MKRVKNMEATAKNLILWKNDPLLYFFKEKLGLSNLRIVLYMTAIAAVILFGLGWIANSAYTTDSDVSFTDPKYYYLALMEVFILTPFLFGLYVSHLEYFTQVLQSFEQTDVIQAVSEKESIYIKSYPDFLNKIQMSVDNKRWTIIALILSAVFLGNWFLEFNTVGRSVFWYDVKWLRVVVLLYLFVYTYAASLIIFKGVQSVLYTNRLFQWFDVRVRPMYPDEAGGLGALGNSTLRASALIVGFGMFLAGVTILILFTEGDLFTSRTVVMSWVVYILLTPIVLILPMLSAHRAMKDARNEKLSEIAQEFEKTLSEANVTKVNDTETIKDANEKLQELQTRYSIVANSYPTWPLPARLFRNFSITASLPLMSGLISMVINYSTKQ